jgi:hypothetical protein
LKKILEVEVSKEWRQGGGPRGADPERRGHRVKWRGKVFGRSTRDLVITILIGTAVALAGVNGEYWKSGDWLVGEFAGIGGKSGPDSAGVNSASYPRTIAPSSEWAAGFLHPAARTSPTGASRSESFCVTTRFEVSSGERRTISETWVASGKQPSSGRCR